MSSVMLINNIIVFYLSLGYEVRWRKESSLLVSIEWGSLRSMGSNFKKWELTSSPSNPISMQSRTSKKRKANRGVYKGILNQNGWKKRLFSNIKLHQK